MKIRPVSIMNVGSTFVLTWPSTLRIGGAMSSWPTLFWIGAVTSATKRRSYPANSRSQNARTTGSFTWRTTHSRYRVSDSMRCTPSSVAFSHSSNAATDA